MAKAGTANGHGFAGVHGLTARGALVGGGLALLLAALTAAWFFLPTKEWIGQFTDWIHGLGVLGVVLFGLCYVAAVVLLAPASLLTIAAGLAFGLWAFPLIVVSATVGATLAFLVARYVVRHKVEDLVKKRPNFKAVDQAVSEDGWKIVGLLRLSPLVPFNLQNYFFGITRVGLLPYVAATFVGIMPGTLLYVYLGFLGKAAGGEGGGATKWAFFGVGLVATAVVAFLIARKAKAKLKEAGVKETRK